MKFITNIIQTGNNTGVLVNQKILENTLGYTQNLPPPSYLFYLFKKNS